MTPRLSSSVPAPTVTRRPGSPPGDNPEAQHAAAGTLGKAERRRGLHSGPSNPVDPPARATGGRAGPQHGGSGQPRGRLNQPRRWANMRPCLTSFPATWTSADLGNRRRDARSSHRHDVLGRWQPGATVLSLGRLARGREPLRRRARVLCPRAARARREIAGHGRALRRAEPAVATAWLIIESVSEDLALKKQVFRELDRLAESDAILATNSSSYPSSRLLDAVGVPRAAAERSLPDAARADCGRAYVVRQDRRRGHRCPRRAAAALRARALHRDARERRLLVQPHLARYPARMPDGRRRGRINPRGGRPHLAALARYAAGTVRIMDRIGLDIALAVEEHYATIRDGIPAAPRELLRDYVDRDSSASSPAGASTTTTATDRGQPKRWHDRPRAGFQNIRSRRLSTS